MVLSGYIHQYDIRERLLTPYEGGVASSSDTERTSLPVCFSGVLWPTNQLNKVSLGPWGFPLRDCVRPATTFRMPPLSDEGPASTAVSGAFCSHVMTLLAPDLPCHPLYLFSTIGPHCCKPKKNRATSIAEQKPLELNRVGPRPLQMYEVDQNPSTVRISLVYNAWRELRAVRSVKLI